MKFTKAQKIIGSVIAVIIILIPIVINEAYKLGEGYLVMWTAADLLEFYGAVLGFLGTVVLGYVALLQNSRLIKLEERRYLHDMQPFVTVTNWRARTTSSVDAVISVDSLRFHIEKGTIESQSVVDIVLYFTNTSNSFTMINYNGAKVYHNDELLGEWNISSTNTPNVKLVLSEQSCGEILFCCTKKYFLSLAGKRVELDLILENKLNERYKLLVDLIVTFVSFNNEPYLSMHPQNYRMSKFIKDSDGKTISVDIELV